MYTSLIHKLVLCVLLCIAWEASGQTNDPLFRRFSIEDGLRSNEVYNVFGDSKGYVWAATSRGVAKYDGQTMQTFTTDDGLSDNTVFGFHEDKVGRIWFKPFNGKVGYFDGDSIVIPSWAHAFAEDMESRIITSMGFGEGDTLWLGLSHGTGKDGGGLAYVAPDGNYAIIRPVAQGSGARYVKYFGEETVYGRVYDTEAKGRSKFAFLSDSGYFEYTHVTGGPKSKVHSMLRVFPTPEHTYINFVDTIYKIKRYSGEVEHQVAFNHEAYNMYVDRDNTVFICIAKEGVMIYPDGDLSRVPQRILEGFDVTSVLQDFEGNYWMSTLSNGLLMIPRLSIKIHRSPELDQARITSVRKGEKGVYVGTYNSYFCKLQGETLKWDKKLSNKVVFDSDEDNGFLYASAHDILMKGSAEDGELKQLKDPYAHNAKSIRVTNDTVWYVSNGGFQKYANGNRFYNSLEDRFRERISDFVVLNNGDVLLGGAKGMWRYDGHSYTRDARIPKDTYVEEMMESNGYVYLATRGRGCYILKGDEVVKQFNTGQGLPSNLCSGLAVHGKDLWLGTDHGLVHISEHLGEAKFQTFTKNNGIVSNSISEIAIYRDTVYVGTDKGICSGPITSFRSRVSPPRLYIKKVLAGGDQVVDGGEVCYDNNALQFELSGVTFGFKEGATYRYRLIGVDQDWKESKVGVVDYPFVPNGTFQFEVRAKNVDGEWSAKKQFSFEVLPPFWLTWWFILVEVLIVAVLIFGVVKYQTDKVRKKAAQQLEVSKKMSGLELKALRAQMNPHFTFNTMNSIQRYIVSNDKSKALDYIGKFAKLIRSILNNSREEVITIYEEIETLKLYLELESLRFSDGFEYEIDVDPELDIDFEKIPSMLIQPYIENAIWHGLMNKKSGEKKIVVRFEMVGDELVCTVTDNGVGRDKAMALKRAKDNARRSVGMEITQDRLNILSKLTTRKFEMRIDDLKDSANNPTGTRVVLTISLD